VVDWWIGGITVNLRVKDLRGLEDLGGLGLSTK